MEDLIWLAIVLALGAIAFIYIRLLGGAGEEQGS